MDFDSPRDALARGIATVYQDLAVVPLMSVWRNFFLGAEPTKWGLLKVIDRGKAPGIAKAELAKMGIDIRDTEQAVGTLSGGERQSVAIARAAYFGAKVLILDEPTSALGVKQSGVVLRYIVEARNRGLGVIFITHNLHHGVPGRRSVHDPQPGPLAGRRAAGNGRDRTDPRPCNHRHRQPRGVSHRGRHMRSGTGRRTPARPGSARGGGSSWAVTACWWPRPTVIGSGSRHSRSRWCAALVRGTHSVEPSATVC